MNRPITIIGGGLSGLALGCFLRKHDVKVTIIEQGNYPRHKVCGEFICGVENETLAELGILDLFEHAKSVETIQWHIANKKLLDRKLPRHGMGISRFLLDDALQKRFRNLGGIIQKQRADKSSYLHDQPEGTVWACGKEKQGKGTDTHRWLGIKLHVTGLNIQGLEMHTGASSAKGGYLGLSPIEDGKVNVCGLFEVNKGVSGKGEEKLRAYLISLGLNNLVQRLDKADIVAGSFSAVAGFSMGHQNILANNQQRLMPIGDAALLIPPFTGNGMSIALESALLAGQSLLPYCHGEANADWDSVLKTYLHKLRKTFRKRLIAARWLHPFFFHSSGRWILSTLAKFKLIPFHTLFRLLR
ncbi:MAG: NAD(P)/FAD-dependent oxidoreductase [Akkermansiaceae bacterium]